MLFKQAEVVQLTQQPLRCDTIAQALQDAVERPQQFQLQTGAFLLRFENGSWERLVRRKYSQVLVRKLETEQITTLDQVVQTKQEAQQACTGI